MTDSHDTHGHDDEHDHGGYFHPHVLSAEFLIGVFVALIALTILTVITARIDIVPVQVSMPSIELNDWHVQLSADNAAISTSITGPRSIVNEIADESTGRRLVAILYLRSDELNLRITSKAITFALVTGDGTITALPSSVTVEPSADTVQFTVTRMEQAGSGVDG